MDSIADARLMLIVIRQLIGQPDRSSRAPSASRRKKGPYGADP
jgi:hypothetical protein